MDFWGVEVKSGRSCPVEHEEGKIVHLSQACLGAIKKDKGSEPAYLYVTVDGKKLVLGTLSAENFPQQQFDLVFEKDFELSHNWKHGSVYFCGYKCENPRYDSEDDSAAEYAEDFPAIAADSEKSQSQAKHEKRHAHENANTAKSDLAAGNQKVKIVEPEKDVKTVTEEDDGSSDDASYTDTSEEEPDSDGDDSSDEGETEDEEPPKKVEMSKKRPAESATETPGPDKKAKLVTPQKTDAKKGSVVHVATPHPSKQAGKTPAIQPKPQTPKSAGTHSCKSCTKTFNSDSALQSHTKAKHSVGK